jgi:hypothetical protein
VCVCVCVCLFFGAEIWQGTDLKGVVCVLVHLDRYVNIVSLHLLIRVSGHIISSKDRKENQVVSAVSRWQRPSRHIEFDADGVVWV